MVWSNYNLGFGLGMPYTPFTGGFGLPNYYFTQPSYLTNPLMTNLYFNNFQTNPFYNKSFDSFFDQYPNLTTSFTAAQTYPVTPSVTTSVTPQYTTLFPPIYPFSAAEQITSASNSTKPANTDIEIKTKTETKSETVKNDVFADYNADAGNLLAQNALILSKDFYNQCSAHVNKAIEISGLGMYTDADAYQMLNIMKLNPNFKQIPSDTELSKIPAGCVVIYDRGVAGYSEDFGHIEISTGDGRGVSDGITDEIKPNPSSIFMPIKSL